MSWHPRSTYHPDDRTWVADEGRELPLPTSLRQKPGLSGSVDTPDGGRARANGLPVQGAATLLGCLPSKEPQRRNGGPVARALRVVSKRPRYGRSCQMRLLAKGAGHWRRRAPCSGTVWTQRDPPAGLSTDPSGQVWC